MPMRWRNMRPSAMIAATLAAVACTAQLAVAEDALTVPEILRLKDLVESRDGIEDLEVLAGGSAVKLTQYELDIAEMLYLGAVEEKLSQEDSLPKVLNYVLKEDKPRLNLLSEDAKESAKFVNRKKAYRLGMNAVRKTSEAADVTCTNCLDKENFAKVLPVLNHLPYLEALGEGMDQYLDLARSCGLGDAGTGTEFSLASTDNGLSKENFATAMKKRFGGEDADVANGGVSAQVEALASALDYNFMPGDKDSAEDRGDISVSACEYARSYLSEHHFFDVVFDEGAANKWATMGEKTLTFPKVQEFLKEYHVEDEINQKLLFKIADLSSYFDPAGPPTAPRKPIDDKRTLDQCEFHVLYTMMSRDWKWDTESFFHGGSSDSSIDDVMHPSYRSVKQGADVLMQFKDFKKVIKTIDLGDFIAVTYNADGDYEYYMNSLLHHQPASEGPDSLTLRLFESIAGPKQGEKEQKITAKELEEFLERRLGCKSDDASRRPSQKESKEKIKRQAMSTLRDYGVSTEGGDANKPTIGINEFRAALESYPVLVHGVKASDIEKAVKSLYPDDALDQKKFAAVMLVIQKYGSLLHATDDDKAGDLGKQGLAVGFGSVSGSFTIADYADKVKESDFLSSVGSSSSGQLPVVLEEETGNTAVKEHEDGSDTDRAGDIGNEPAEADKNKEAAPAPTTVKEPAEADNKKEAAPAPTTDKKPAEADNKKEAAPAPTTDKQPAEADNKKEAAPVEAIKEEKTDKSSGDVEMAKEQTSNEAKEGGRPEDGRHKESSEKESEKEKPEDADGKKVSVDGGDTKTATTDSGAVDEDNNAVDQRPPAPTLSSDQANSGVDNKKSAVEVKATVAVASHEEEASTGSAAIKKAEAAEGNDSMFGFKMPDLNMPEIAMPEMGALMPNMGDMALPEMPKIELPDPTALIPDMSAFNF